MILNKGIMEAGYSTVDLVMLAIAAFIIWMVMRTPKSKSVLGATGMPSGTPHSPTL